MKLVYFIILGMLACSLCSCGQPKNKSEQVDEKISLDTHIEQLAVFPPFAPVAVNGFGITAGLWGTGSAECPANLRPILEKYIRQQVPNSTPNSVREFIDSSDTAVVEIVGQIPPMAMAGDHFDIMISAVAKTQTTSLESGQLFSADLMEIGRLVAFDQYAKKIGTAQGQVFTITDPNTNRQSYYVLGGGVALVNMPISLLLKQPNYYAAAAIRNRINERFGTHTANAVSRNEVQITIPSRYRRNRTRFLSMIRLLYLSEDETLRSNRINELGSQLGQLQNAEDAEFALEAIGRPAVSKLFELIDPKNPEESRLRAARCLLNIGESRAVLTLGEIAQDEKSLFRIAAIEALAAGKLSDVEPIMTRLIEDTQFEVRFAAYERLVGLGSILVSRIPVGPDFFVDLVHSKSDKIIYAYRKDNAGIVLFGSPILCNKDIFIDMKQVMINVRPDETMMSLSRRHPGRPKLVGPVKCGFRVEDVIRTLGHTPEEDLRKISWPGLGISYSEILTILEQMCSQGIIPAQIILGTPTDAGSFLEKSAPKTDNTSVESTKSK